MDIDTFISDLQKSEATKRTYRYGLYHFEDFLDGRKPTERLAREFIRKLGEDGKSKSTISTLGYAIRRYFRWTGKHIDLELPPVSIGPAKYISKEELMRLLKAAADPFDKVLIMLLYDTGMRIKEMLGITRKDIDWDTKTIHIIRKGGHHGWVTVGDPTIEAMKIYDRWRKKGSGSSLFFPYKYAEVDKWFGLIVKRAGIQHITLHWLRHSRAAHLLLDDQPLEDVSAQLGHRSLTTTAKIYGQLRPEHLKAKLKPTPWERSS